ncbi:MAG: lysophospholipid acyltransferase family protein [Planctomycetes bacterium]|nr:lysophospholipid acyltransferase family protein [Planctomycetota bacterium]
MRDGRRPERRPSLRHRLEYLGLKLGLLLIDRLPPAATVWLARAVADLWYAVDARRRQIACENILRSGVAASPRAAARIARASFRHLPLVVLESLRSERLFARGNWRERVVFEAPAETMALLAAPGQGLILVSGHLGNWEIAAQLLSKTKPVTGITRGMNNPLAHALMLRRKPRARFTLMPMHDANPARFFAVLRRGDVLALLMDQHARRRGMMVPFFGTPASTHTSPALLHLVTGAPLCFGYCVRTGPGAFRLVAGPPLSHPPTGRREEDIRTILEALNRQLEDAIRRYPEQYLWVHRRWRERPAAG